MQDTDETPYANVMFPSSRPLMEAIEDDLKDAHKGLLGYGLYSMVLRTKDDRAAKYTVDTASVLWAHHIKSSTNRYLPKIYGISPEPVFEAQGFPVWRIDMEMLESRNDTANRYRMSQLSNAVATSLIRVGQLTEMQTDAHNLDVDERVVTRYLTEDFAWAVECLNSFMVKHKQAMLDLHCENWMWRKYSACPVLVDPVYGNLYHARTPVHELKMLGDQLGLLVPMLVHHRVQT